MKIYPVKGRLVRDPRTRLEVPATGMTVSSFDPFWVRRVRDGDVTTKPPEADPAETAPAATPEATKAETTAQETKS